MINPTKMVKDMVAGAATSSTPAWGTCSTNEDSQAYGDQRDPWDILELAGKKMPGIASVSGAACRQIDIKKHPGKDGATFTDLGRDLGRYSARLTIWTQAQLASLEGMVPLIQPTSKAGKLEAVSVKHLGLNLNGVTSVYVERVGVLQPSGAAGMWALELGLLEYRPIAVSGGNTIGSQKRDLGDHDPASRDLSNEPVQPKPSDDEGEP